MRRILYFFYYLKELNFRKLQNFLHYAEKINKSSSVLLLSDSVYSSFKYNISILDYFYFRFFEKSTEQRKTFAGTGYMFEYQLQMNPMSTRNILADKIQFLEVYKEFIERKHASFTQMHQDSNLAESLLSNTNRKLVVKNAKGQVGAEVEVISTEKYNSKSLIEFMRKNNYELAEEFIVQHNALMQLSPSGLNTVRIITQIFNGEVIFIGARLRISINSHVDNMAAGNAAATIDLQTGKVSGPAVFSDITKNDFQKHPITGMDIIGFQIPFWSEIKTMVQRAALLRPENRSIGWDVAVRNDGPELVEGNHNWCKLLWQLPVKKGLKHELEKFKA